METSSATSTPTSAEQPRGGRQGLHLDLASDVVVRAVTVVTVDEAAATVETLDTLVTDPARGALQREANPVEVDCPSVGAVLAGRYLLERVLGQGGMGTVFAARHVVTGKRVARPRR